MIEWDEALDSDTSGLNGGSGGQVPTIVVSAALKAAPVPGLRPSRHGRGPALRSRTPTASRTSAGSVGGRHHRLPAPGVDHHASHDDHDVAHPHDNHRGDPVPHHDAAHHGPPTTAPPTTAPPTTAPPSTAPSTSSRVDIHNVTVVPEAGTSAQGLTATVSPAPAGRDRAVHSGRLDGRNAGPPQPRRHRHDRRVPR